MLFQKKYIEKAAGIIPGKSIGVLAIKTFKPGEIVEKAPLILLAAAEKEPLQNTVLFDYYFLTGNAKTPVGVALGMASLYNHAAMPNAAYRIDLKREILFINAICLIQPGEEITINYYGKPGNDAPVFLRKQENDKAAIS